MDMCYRINTPHLRVQLADIPRTVLNLGCRQARKLTYCHGIYKVFSLWTSDAIRCTVQCTTALIFRVSANCLSEEPLIYGHQNLNTPVKYKERCGLEALPPRCYTVPRANIKPVNRSSVSTLV
jgi:hypothetical protein